MKNMKPKALVFVIALSLFAIVQVVAEISEAEARAHLKSGARVVDVRTVEEYQAKHLTNVVNIPLAEVKEKFPQLVTNKNEVVLLHCRSGRRSGMAEAQLRAMGYTNVFNIGSFEKAEKILSATDK